MIEVSESGVRSVHFSLNDDAVTAVHQINKQTITGRLGSVNRTEWIAIAALIVSIAALFKPEILALFKPES